MTRDRLVARIATGSIGVCVLILIGTLAFPFVRSAVGEPVPRAGYAAGDRLDVPAGIYDRHAYTVVIFARSGCGVCQQLKPALARVTAAVAAMPSMGVAVIAPDSNPRAEEQFAREIGCQRGADAPRSQPAAAPDGAGAAGGRSTRRRASSSGPEAAGPPPMKPTSCA